jgi:electron transport complex protein RnfG
MTSSRPLSGLTSPDPAVAIDESGSYEVLKNGETIGLALTTSRAGYSGAIRILVGVGMDSKISGVKILEQSETPGLGTNAASDKYYVDRAKGIRFYEQFAGKNVSDPFVPKQDVISISAATITSRAVADSVKAAGEAASAWFATGTRGGSR